MEKIKGKNNQTIANIYSFLSGSIHSILEQIDFDDQFGYAGLKNKEYLEDVLKKYSQLSSEDKKLNFSEDFVGTIKETIGRIIKEAYSVLPAKKPLSIFLLPSLNKFFASRMAGVGGFTPYQGVIHLYINPHPKNKKKFFKFLRFTLAHEYAHALRLKYFPEDSNYTLFQTMVFEGLADNFSHQVVGQKPPWVPTIKGKKLKKIKEKIKPLLNSQDYHLYQKLFFGSQEFPLWSGYALSFQLVNKFLKKYSNKGWPEIIKLKAEKFRD